MRFLVGFSTKTIGFLHKTWSYEREAIASKRFAGEINAFCGANRHLILRLEKLFYSKRKAEPTHWTLINEILYGWFV